MSESTILTMHPITRHTSLKASPLAQLESYNVGNDIWTALTSMPTVRGDKAAAVLNGQLHVIGGETKSADGVTAAISDVEVYNPTTNTWVDEGPIPSERFRFVAAAVDDTIYVFGGQTFRFGGHLAPGSYYAVVDTVEAFQEIVNSKSSAQELTGGCILSILITVVGAATAF
jgi:N-acetylneuraminic acid mutarotase